jgi:hypothetical protein
MEKNKNLFNTVGLWTAGLVPHYFVLASCPAPIYGSNATYLAYLILLHLIDLMTISKEHKSQNCSLCQKKATVKQLQLVSEHGRCSVYRKFLIFLKRKNL